MNSKKVLALLSIVFVGAAAFYGGMKIDESLYERNKQVTEEVVEASGSEEASVDISSENSSKDVTELTAEPSPAPAEEAVSSEVIKIDNNRLASIPNFEESEDVVSYIILGSNRRLSKDSITDKIIEAYDGKKNEKLTESLDNWVNKDATIYETSWRDALNKYNNGDDFYVFCSATWCPYCNAEIGCITDAAVEAGVPIYYLDIDKYPRTNYQTTDGKITMKQINYDFEEFMKTAGVEQFPERGLDDADGKNVLCGLKTIYVPSVIHVTPEKITMFSYPSGFDDADGVQENEVEILTDSLVSFFKGEMDNTSFSPDGLVENATESVSK